MKRSTLIFLFISFLFLIGCSKSSEEPSDGGDSTAESQIDISDIDATFLPNERYGSSSRAVMDVWYIPNSPEPTGLVIYVHGGGFKSGSKEFVRNYSENLDKDFPNDIRNLLMNKVAFVAINYSLLNSVNEQVGVRKCLNDIKYALQFLRSNAEDYNIDPTKVIMAGNSAGAGASLLLAVNSDLKKPNASDPVLRESTLLSGIVLFNTQASFDLTRWGATIFEEYDLNWTSILNGDIFRNVVFDFYGVQSVQELQNPEVQKQLSKLQMLRLISSDDPEIFAETLRNKMLPVDRDDYNHHVNHVAAIKERCEDMGVPITAYYGKDPIIYADPSGESWTDFILRKFSE